MNVAFLNSIEKETFGGMEEWIRLVSKGLITRGHRVSLLGRRGSEYLRRVGGAIADANVVDLDISGDFNPITIARIRRFLKENRTDVIVTNFNKDVRLGGLAARHNDSVKVVWSMGINTTRDRMVHRWLTPRLVDSVIVPSQALKDEVVRCGYVPDEIIDVIPIGIECGPRDPATASARTDLRSKYNLPTDATVAVTVGRLVPQKGHEYLVEAAPKIVASYPSLYFLLLGNGPNEPELKSRIIELGIEEHFVFAGMLDNTDRELAGADLMIHPSKEEPFGIVLLEGMRAGLPIVASRVGGIPEVVDDGNTAHLFESCNPGAIADTTISLLEHPDQMQLMGRKGYERCREKFGVDLMVQQVERHFTEVKAGRWNEFSWLASKMTGELDN